MIRSDRQALTPLSSLRRPTEAKPTALGTDSVQTGGESAAPLSLVEHNEAQIDLMRRMGVDVKNPRAMVGWISQHAANFSTLLEGPENADNARVWRAMLRRPEQRVAALEAMQRALLVH